MSDLVYEYKNNIYINLTNKCSANCVFCVRAKTPALGEATDLFLKREPETMDFIRALETFDLSKHHEIIFCGYGEPTCEIDKLIEIADRIKKKYDIKIRVNTNGLGRLYNQRDILKEMNPYVDAFSISLNAAGKARYDELVRPSYENAYAAMLEFAKDAKALGKEVVLSVLSLLSDEEIHAAKGIADSLGAALKVRTYVE